MDSILLNFFDHLGLFLTKVDRLNIAHYLDPLGTFLAKS